MRREKKERKVHEGSRYKLAVPESSKSWTIGTEDKAETIDASSNNKMITTN